MKKFLSLSLVFLLAFTYEVSAQEIPLEKIDFVGGITYNTFDGTYVENGAIYDDEYNINNGIGMHIGGKYWLNKMNAIETGFDMTRSFGDTTKLNGPYALFIRKPYDFLSLKGGLAYYSMSFADEATYGNGLGYLLGGSHHYSLDDKLSVLVSVDYRIAYIDIKKRYGTDMIDTYLNMSGFRISGGASLKF